MKAPPPGPFSHLRGRIAALKLKNGTEKPPAEQAVSDIAASIIAAAAKARGESPASVAPVANADAQSIIAAAAKRDAGTDATVSAVTDPNALAIIAAGKKRRGESGSK